MVAITFQPYDWKSFAVAFPKPEDDPLIKLFLKCVNIKIIMQSSPKSDKKVFPFQGNE